MIYRIWDRSPEVHSMSDLEKILTGGFVILSRKQEEVDHHESQTNPPCNLNTSPGSQASLMPTKAT